LIDGKITTTTLAERDKAAHDGKQNPIVGAYSLSSLQRYGNYMDEIVTKFLTKTDELLGSDTESTLDMGS
jgi:hypothetical protein